MEFYLNSDWQADLSVDTGPRISIPVRPDSDRGSEGPRDILVMNIFDEDSSQVCLILNSEEIGGLIDMLTAAQALLDT